MDLFDYFSPKKSKADIESETEQVLANVFDDELATLVMQHSAMMAPGPSAILTPAIPLPAKDTAGWFGGAPRLPIDLAWPEIDGTPLCFVAQIDLTQVPQDIWSGAGPRQGQFAFFIHPTETKAKVLHFDGALEKRLGPSPVSSYWFRKHYDKGPLLSEYFREWPVQLTGNVGRLPIPTEWTKGKAPDFPNPCEDETLDLTDPAHHPFDKAT